MESVGGGRERGKGMGRRTGMWPLKCIGLELPRCCQNFVFSTGFSTIANLRRLSSTDLVKSNFGLETNDSVILYLVRRLTIDHSAACSGHRLSVSSVIIINRLRNLSEIFACLNVFDVSEIRSLKG